MSSLIASQSTLCLQMRQDAVANEPEKKESLKTFHHGQNYKKQNKPRSIY